MQGTNKDTETEAEREERMGAKSYRIFNWKKKIGILFVLSALRGRS